MFQSFFLTHPVFSKYLVLLCVVVLVPACAYDSEEDLFPGGDQCDTNDVSYTQEGKISAFFGVGGDFDA